MYRIKTNDPGNGPGSRRGSVGSVVAGSLAPATRAGSFYLPRSFGTSAMISRMLASVSSPR